MKPVRPTTAQHLARVVSSLEDITLDIHSIIEEHCHDEEIEGDLWEAYRKLGDAASGLEDYDNDDKRGDAHLE